MLSVTSALDVNISLSLDLATGLLIARSLDCYRIDHKALQQNLSNYQFENQTGFVTSLMIILGRLMPHVMPGQESSDDIYPWLETNDPQRYWTDGKVLERCLDLAEADFLPSEETLKEIIFKYKEAFKLILR